VEEFTHFPLRLLAQKEMVETAGARDDDSSNSRTSVAFLAMWVSVVEI
jgi:hypothetical protein